ncbi:MAG TPA: hypothetical protein PLP23_23100 [Panacibacter sp.]|nr:hypothetical protein [Panacibacter sp.]
MSFCRSEDFRDRVFGKAIGSVKLSYFQLSVSDNTKSESLKLSYKILLYG